MVNNEKHKSKSQRPTANGQQLKIKIWINYWTDF